MTSIFAWYGYELPLREHLRLIKAAGFDSVMLWWSEEPTFASYPGKEYLAQPEYARDIGLGIENIHAPYWEANGLWEDTAAGQAAFDYFLKCIDDCAVLEIPAMVMHASCGEAPPESEIGLRRFALLIERAEQKGVNIALENMRRASQIEQAGALLERFDSPRFGLCYDAGHYNCRLLRTPEADFLSRFGHRLMALHLHDNEGEIAGNNNVDQHRLPFDGTIDWPVQMRLIAETGYNGATALEINNMGYEALPPQEFLNQAYERAVKLDQLRTI